MGGIGDIASMGFAGAGSGQGKGSAGLTPQESKDVTSAESSLVNLIGEQATNAEQMYKLAEPGMVQAQNFYETLASGDPGAIMRATAPTAQAASEAATGARANIMANAPPGGEKNLALEQVDRDRAAQIAKTASGASLGAENALAKLGTTGVGLSTSESGAAVGAAGGLAGMGQLRIASQQQQMEQKGQSMWPIALLAQGPNTGKGGGAGGALGQNVPGPSFGGGDFSGASMASNFGGGSDFSDFGTMDAGSMFPASAPSGGGIAADVFA
jgi:hypothetical protein